MNTLRATVVLLVAWFSLANFNHVAQAQDDAMAQARRLFDRYVALGAAYDVAVADLYADSAFIKNTRFGSRKTAQFKLEALNLLNRPNVRTIQGANTFGNANFGQTTIQVGFSRILQFMFRVNF